MNKLEIFKQILNYSIKNNKSVRQASIFFNKSNNFFKRNRYMIDTCPELQELYSQYIKTKNSSSNYVPNKPTALKATTKSIISEHDDDIDSQGSTTFIERDSDNKILYYHYSIPIKDSLPIVGKFSRIEFELLYSNYPYITRNSLSQFFPYLNFLDFKRILRVFNITKDKLFPQHILEEHTEEQIAEFALKAKEHSSHKKFIENKNSFFEQTTKNLQKELYSIQDNKDFILENLDSLLKKYSTDGLLVKKQAYTGDKDEPKSLFIYISDQHVGASNNYESLYDNEYNEKIYIGRIDKILENVIPVIMDNNFENIYINNLGDNLDGYNGFTTRGGHTLEQNLDNKEQYKVYINSMIYLFNELYKYSNKFNNLHVFCVGDDNHSGDFGYMANYSLKILSEKMFENLTYTIFDKTLGHYQYGVHTFILSHGKDKKSMKSNMPLILDHKTENLLTQYIMYNNIPTTDNNISFIKGDLHQSCSQTGKLFRYKNIGSIFGSSGYIMLNFGFTKPSFSFDIVYKEKNIIYERYINLQ
jgi:hypothetical protein